MMLKSIAHEPSFTEYFKGCDNFRCGFLIGGSSGNEEHLFLPVHIPNKEPTCESTVVRDVHDLDEKWIASHWLNLQRMLPGGVRISGLCLTSSVSDFSGVETKLKTIFNHLPAQDLILDEIVGTSSSEKLLLLVDLPTLKFTGKAFDGSRFRPIQIKSRSLLDSYVAYKTHVNLSLETSLPTDRKKEQILLQLRDAVQPYLTALLTDAKLLVNGEFMLNTDSVLKDQVANHTTSSEKRSKKSTNKTAKRRSAEINANKSDRGDDSKSRRRKDIKSESTKLDYGSWAEVDLTIFGSHFPQWQRASSSSSLDSGASSDTGHTGSTDLSDSSVGPCGPINRLILNGRIPGIAYLPVNATVGTLFEALRQDLIQSILARLELLAEELHITSAELEIPRMLLPQRVIVRLPVCPSLPLCDYKFLSETPDDVVARLHYICVPLGVQSFGVGEDTILDSHLEIDATGNQHSADTAICPKSFSSSNHIDTSCLDISLEQSPESSIGDEYSETEFLETVTQTVQPVTKSLNEAVFDHYSVALGVTYLSLFFTSLVAYLIASFLDPGYLTHENARLFRHRRGQLSVVSDSKSEVGDLCEAKGMSEQECPDPTEIYEVYGDVNNAAQWSYLTRMQQDCFICPNIWTMFPCDTNFLATYEDPVISLSVPVRFCRRCLLEQPLRCRHCPQCNRCVIKFDHHCPWIANCVGERNHCAFVTYLILQVVVLWWTVYFAWSSIIPNHVLIDWFRINGLYLAELVVLMLIGVPLTGLLSFHTYLALASRTTWETVAYEQIAYLRSLNERTNPFNQGWARNCYAFCCSPYPFGWDRIYADHASGQTVSPVHATTNQLRIQNPVYEPQPNSMSASPTPEIHPVIIESSSTIHVVPSQSAGEQPI